MKGVCSPGLSAAFVLQQASQAAPPWVHCDQDGRFRQDAYHLTPCSPAQISGVN